MSTHTPTVTFDRSRRSPHVPACSCGWEYGWGYLTKGAAQGIADDHAARSTTAAPLSGFALEVTRRTLDESLGAVR